MTTEQLKQTILQLRVILLTLDSTKWSYNLLDKCITELCAELGKAVLE